ncbi:MAG: multiprotein bridging factor aMBF1 [Thermoplasmataceae archaeon]
MECEMCGKKAQRLTKIRIDGAILSVCDDCSRFGTPLTSLRAHDTKKVDFQGQVTLQVKERPVIIGKARSPQKIRRDGRKADEELEIVPDYFQIIKDAREKMSLTQEELALKMMEKKHVLANIERGDLKPDMRTARKLEKLLKITLLEEF